MLSRLPILVLNQTGLHIINKVCLRGLRGMIKPQRTRLHKYQKNILNLPPLTQLLVASIESKSLEKAKELRVEKLAVYKSYMPNDNNFTLLEALFHPNHDVGQLLQVIEANLESMNSFYIAISFEVLDDMMRAQLCHVATVIVSPEFRKLCTKALYKMRFFESDEILKIIKCLSTIQVPENSLIAQAALQMSRYLLNDFDEHELKALGQALEQMKVQHEPKKSLLEAIKKAQQILLQSKLYSIELISNK